MSAFGGKADMTIWACPLSRSLLGVKRTWAGALHMSAFDPKRTWLVAAHMSAFDPKRTISAAQLNVTRGLSGATFGIDGIKFGAECRGLQCSANHSKEEPR